MKKVFKGIMINTNKLFLQALKAALLNKKVKWTEEMTADAWAALFNQAQIHHVLPMIYEAVYACPAAKKMPPDVLRPFKRQVYQQVMVQTVKTQAFLRLNDDLQKAGIKVLVMKGIVCRNIYPKPDYRQSCDEDILIPAEQFRRCHEVMKGLDMYLLEPDKDIDEAYEVSYGKHQSPLYIELHKTLFSPASDAYGDFNCYFEGVFERMTEVEIQDSTIYTMGYTDHLFYLICHAFKHFLHSGFGIRQVCDIILFANTYGKEIDWDIVLENCRKIRADLFAAALFQIGKKYLCFDQDKACYPQQWRKIQVDERAILEDLLDGGVYGNANMNRRHSSNMTLGAVSAGKQGKKSGNGKGIILSLFPPIAAMKCQYSYLEKKPYLLPAAWIQRISKYSKETGNVFKGNTAETIKIGARRVELLKQYGIIDK